MSESRTLLLVGATSDIGLAIARRYAEEGWRIILTARALESAERNRADVAARSGMPVELFSLDMTENEGFSRFVDALPVQPDTVVCAVGELGDQARSERDPGLATSVMLVNYVGPSLLLGIIAERMRTRGSGTIVGISSVAGDRGRGSNYVYGSAKAGFTAFLSGLRNGLNGTGVHVLTVKPGFVRTRMTRDMKLPPLLTAAPEELGDAVFVAAEKRRRNVVYVRPVWRAVMGVIGAIPEPIFKKLKL